MYRIQALFILLLIVLNTLFWCLPLFGCALLRAVGPDSLRPSCTRIAMAIAECWISCNNVFFNWFGLLDMRVQSDVPTADNEWQLVICNHQAWADIFVLQALFNRKIPMLKFFIKDTLLYVPVIGIAWWVLDFPVVKRYSRQALADNPDLRKRDRASTLKACESFKLTPVSVLNFLEGTRFTPAKHERLNSPYQYLLPPKAGGVSLVIDALQAHIAELTDVTIRYVDGPPSLLEFLGGRGGSVQVHIDRHTLPSQLPFTDYDADEHTREAVKAWLDQLWRRKDALLTKASGTGSASGANL